MDWVTDGRSVKDDCCQTAIVVAPFSKACATASIAIRACMERRSAHSPAPFDTDIFARRRGRQHGVMSGTFESNGREWDLLPTLPPSSI